MNQRRSRNNNSQNNLDFMSFNTGGHSVRHAPNEEAKVGTPPLQKTTGEIKPEAPKGAAKASPTFKPITPPAKAMDKQDEKNVIAENSVPVDDKKSDATE